MATRVKLELSPEELNLVLVGVAKLPYVQVHELIARIQSEAGPQLLEAMQRAEADHAQESKPWR